MISQRCADETEKKGNLQGLLNLLAEESREKLLFSAREQKLCVKNRHFQNRILLSMELN